MSTAVMSLDDDRILALELLRATEAAAIAAARFLGRGDKVLVDAAAVDAMRPVLGTIPMRGVVVIGKGEKDNVPMVHSGEQVGSGSGPLVDIAIDPVDGAGLTAKSLPNALSVIALADRGAMFDPGPCVYMDKLVVGADLVDAVDFGAPIEDTLAVIARVRGVGVADVTVACWTGPGIRSWSVGSGRPGRGSSSSSPGMSPARCWRCNRNRREFIVGCDLTVAGRELLF